MGAIPDQHVSKHRSGRQQKRRLKSSLRLALLLLGVFSAAYACFVRPHCTPASLPLSKEELELLQMMRGGGRAVVKVVEGKGGGGGGGGGGRGSGEAEGSREEGYFLEGGRDGDWEEGSAGYLADHPELIHARLQSQEEEEEPVGLWESPQQEEWRQCDAPSRKYREAPVPESNGYLQVFLDGGLNQQRISVCNAVTVARLLNATLIVPEFATNPFWQDTSQFADIFDVDHFISSLHKDVRIERSLPPHLAWSTSAYYASSLSRRNKLVRSAPLHATKKWYLKRVLPRLKQRGIVAMTSFSHRLAFTGLPKEIQRLRCRVNFHALRFVQPIRELGQKLVRRLQDPSLRPTHRGVLYSPSVNMSAFGMEDGGMERDGREEARGETEEGGMKKGEGRGLDDIIAPWGGLGRETGTRSSEGAEAAEAEDRAASKGEDGAVGGGHETGEDRGHEVVEGGRRRRRFLALHLRFDLDMVAHSACDYGEAWEEQEQLRRYREYAWGGRVANLQHSPQHLRAAGKCPLTPEEVGLLLAALGFSRATRLYVATYQVYGGASRMAALRRLFPNLEDKTSLATQEELRPFLGRASMLAALDFYVSMHSDVFVSTSQGNMHNVMAGYRAYFGGHKTIKLNAPLLASLLQTPNLTWPDFTRAVQTGHEARLGQIKARRVDQSLYTYPAPECLCKVEEGEGQRGDRRGGLLEWWYGKQNRKKGKGQAQELHPPS
ncbi:hypothetical protein CLOP_g9805 [Closterium sp. NIES-67]|nr:hypothetical protein CLOP_g9805 [Closterium sp. NIES-67]